MNEVLTWPVGRDLDVEHQRAIRSTHPATPVLLYVLASGAGGAVTGLMLGLVGWLLDQSDGAGAASATAVVVSTLGVWGELTGHVSPLPELRKQVPRRWIAW